MSVNLSLERLQRIVHHLPQYTRPTCHIAGTNGKGSVTAILSSILQLASPPLSVGRYNSPHLTTIYDCIVINNHPVDPGLYDSVRTLIERVDREHTTNLSNFELLTLTALQIFEHVGVDVAVVEVGMGGRLDATNIIPDEAILVSALTSVDLDHQAFLGNTVAEIAQQKVGIARSGRPFVLGPQKYTEVVDVVKKAIEHQGAIPVPLVGVSSLEDQSALSIFLRPVSFSPPKSQQVSCSFPQFSKPIVADFPLYGQHQVDNLATALTVISVLCDNSSPNRRFSEHITPQVISQGIENVRWRGRLSFHTISLPKPLPALVDGTHNPGSAKTLADYLTHILSLTTDQTIDPTYILALSHSPPKAPHQTLFPLLLLPAAVSACVRMHIALLTFSPPEGMPWVRPVPPADLAKVVKELAPSVDCG